MRAYPYCPLYKLPLLLLSIIVLPGYTSHSPGKEHERMPAQARWQSLFNGKNLDGWNTYLAPRYNAASDKMEGEPVGLNKDPQKVFTIVKEDGLPAIRISGEGFGAISTQKEYENYHLQLEFKWGALKWPPKKDKKRDSGILYHSVGPYGADYGAWMRSQEFQIEEGNCGDYWGVAGGTFDIKATKNPQGVLVYDPNGALLTFSAVSPAGRHCTKSPDAEKPSGQWNKIDLYCHGDTSVHMVNGVVTMILVHSRQYDNGVESPLTKGSLQIQSEGAEVFYRNIRLQPLDRIPTSF